MLNLKVGCKYINRNGEIVVINRSINRIRFSVGRYMTSKESHSENDNSIRYIDSQDHSYCNDGRSCSGNSNNDIVKEIE